MSVANRVKNVINSDALFAYLLALVLSTLLAGYAISSITLGIFIFFSIRFWIVNKMKIDFSFALLVPIMLYTLFCFTLFWTVDKNHTVTGLTRLISMILVPLAFCITPLLSRNSFKKIFEYFTNVNILFGLIFLMVAIFRFIKSKDSGVFFYHDLVGIFDFNAIYVSVIFAVSLFFLLSKELKTIWDGIKIFFFFGFLLLLSSKTVILVLLLGVIIYGLLIGFRANNWLKLALFGFFSILTIYVARISMSERIVFETKSKFNEVLNKKEFGKIYKWTGSSIRLFQLRILKEQIEQESIFWKGFGLFASRDSLKKAHEKYDTYEEFHYYNYHNQYAQILSEIGILGLVLLLTMLMISFIKAVRQKNIFFIMFTIIMGAVFITESFLWRQKGIYLFIIVYCILMRTEFNSRTSQSFLR